jgi:hypothetical protein
MPYHCSRVPPLLRDPSALNIKADSMLDAKALSAPAHPRLGANARDEGQAQEYGVSAHPTAAALRARRSEASPPELRGRAPRSALAR